MDGRVGHTADNIKIRIRINLSISTCGRLEGAFKILTNKVLACVGRVVNTVHTFAGWEFRGYDRVG